jgi:hypothetical protein
MGKIKSIKTIENKLHEELEDIMKFIDIRGDTIEIASKDENPLSVSIMNGEQITPRQREVNIKLNFKAHDEPTYLKSHAMIPLKRTRKLFERGLVADIKNTNCYMQVPGEINYMYTLSFLRDVNEEEVNLNVTRKIGDIIRYNYSFIKLHNELFEKGKELEQNWNNNTKKTKQEVKPKKYEDDIIKVTTFPMMRENDLVFIIADYKTPEKLNPLEKDDMFPNKRLNTLLPKIFPSPKAYMKGNSTPLLPPIMNTQIDEQEPGITRRLYQMDFDLKNSNGTRIEKTLNLIREKYIPDFVKLHYDTYNRIRK